MGRADFKPVEGRQACLVGSTPTLFRHFGSAVRWSNWKLGVGRAGPARAPAREPESIPCKRVVPKVEKLRDPRQPTKRDDRTKSNRGVKAAKNFDALNERTVAQAPVDAVHQQIPVQLVVASSRPVCRSELAAFGHRGMFTR